MLTLYEGKLGYKLRCAYRPWPTFVLLSCSRAGDVLFYYCTEAWADLTALWQRKYVDHPTDCSVGAEDEKVARCVPR